jgi:predicted ATP-binding protein involved in virulence
MTAKITGFSVQDFKRVKLVEIQPTENGLTILGGRNAQGKSSCLDAIAYALGGEAFRPSDVNNHESESNAAIKVEINGLTVERTGKNAALKITDSRGMRGNQTLLNDIVSKFALDLGTFMKAGDTEKTKLLLKMFPELEKNLAELKTQADGIREARADQNRDIKRMQVTFDQMPSYPDLPAEEINVTALSGELIAAMDAEKRLEATRNRLTRQNEEIGHLRMKKTNGESQIESTRKDIEELEQVFLEQKRKLLDIISSTEKMIGSLEHEITNAETMAKEIKGDIEKQVQATAGKAEDIQKRIHEAEEVNAKIRANSEKRKLYEDLSEKRKIADNMTDELQDIEADRTALLQNAKLPLPELSISENGELLYRGQKWDCMSGSERLKVATAICMKSKPGCGFVLIDGLEAMDAQTLAEFAEFLTEQNMQGIGTIVGENSATVIIEDGKVKENTPTTADHNTTRK